MPSEARSRIFAGLQLVPEDGASAVPALDGAVEVVPLVDPAHWGVGDLLVIELGDRFAAGDFAEEGECPVEHAAVVGGGDDGVGDAVEGGRGEPGGVGGKVGFNVELGGGLVKIGKSAEDDGGFGGQGRLDAQGAAEHAADATEQLALCTLRHGRRCVSDDGCGHADAVLTGGGLVQRGVAEPGIGPGFGVEYGQEGSDQK